MFKENLMSCLRKPLRIAFTALSLALANVGVMADVTTYFAAQAPKADLNVPTPPPLVGVALKKSEFDDKVIVRGTQEFESGGLNFAYIGGTATVSGTATGPINGNVAQPSLGRYNTTTGLGGRNFGHWMASSDDFSIAFSSAISALSFLGTDFFDFNGSIVFSLFNGLDEIDVAVDTIETRNNDALNGNLVFFGVTSDVAFDRISFSVAQAVGSTEIDVLGFDSFVVGNLIVAPPGGVPEPGSLALVGLALLAMAGSRRSRKH